MKYAILLIISLNAFTVKSQTSEDSIKTVINRMFTAMKNGDAAMLKSCFADSAILQTVLSSKEGKISVETEPLAEFADFVGKQEKGVADEQIVFETLKTDGQLALAWAPYKFYYKGKFSHCGIDSFQLVKINGEWKIQYLIDTRRKTGCE
ncbi:MAG: nuclear transport factor 2 family protein [Ferruginibacter sp.]